MSLHNSHRFSTVFSIGNRTHITLKGKNHSLQHMSAIFTVTKYIMLINPSKTCTDQFRSNLNENKIPFTKLHVNQLFFVLKCINIFGTAPLQLCRCWFANCNGIICLQVHVLWQLFLLRITIVCLRKSSAVATMEVVGANDRACACARVHVCTCVYAGW